MKIYCSRKDKLDLSDFAGKDLWIKVRYKKSRFRGEVSNTWLKIYDYDDKYDTYHIQTLSDFSNNIHGHYCSGTAFEIIQPLEVLTLEELIEDYSYQLNRLG